MEAEEICKVLGWCLAINMGFLMAWSLMFMFARDLVYRKHTILFKIPEERFDEINYTMMHHFKLAVAFFNLVPYLALRIVIP